MSSKFRRAAINVYLSVVHYLSRLLTRFYRRETNSSQNLMKKLNKYRYRSSRQPDIHKRPSVSNLSSITPQTHDLINKQQHRRTFDECSSLTSKSITPIEISHTEI